MTGCDVIKKDLSERANERTNDGFTPPRSSPSPSPHRAPSSSAVSRRDRFWEFVRTSMPLHSHMSCSCSRKLEKEFEKL